MRYCETCDHEFSNPRCPRCGRAPASRRDHDDPSQDPAIVSDPPPTIDTMIEQASRPTLAQLLKRGLEKGLIKPLHDYAQGRK